MYPEFSLPSDTPPATKLSVNPFRTQNLAEIVRDIPIRGPVEICEMAGNRILVIRDQALFKTLADSDRLGRGRSHQYVQRIFGPETVFMLPGGPKHKEKKSELKGRLSKAGINAMVPNIAAEAAAAVDSMLAHSAEPINMEVYVLRYLFHVAAQALAGAPVYLDEHVRTFQANMATILSSASSTVQLALASVSGALGKLLSQPARNAASGMFDIGRKLLCEGGRNPQDNLVTDMLRRYDIDPKTVNEKTEFPSELLLDISMTFAASIFTTSNLVLGVIHYFGRNPEQLRELRFLMETDFPGGMRSVSQLTANASIRKLWPIMVQQSSVDLVVRDVIDAGNFCDPCGVQHQINKGDIVVFDLSSTQRSLMYGLQERLNALPASSPFLDFLDARNNDVNVMFFDGANQCPGRNLMAADGLLLLLELVKRVDMTSETPTPCMKPGLVNTFPGPILMTVRPPAALDDELHRQLLGGRPPTVGQEPDRPAHAATYSACPLMRGTPRLPHPLNC